MKCMQQGHYIYFGTSTGGELGYYAVLDVVGFLGGRFVSSRSESPIDLSCASG